jgi:hypothetical protein
MLQKILFKNSTASRMKTGMQMQLQKHLQPFTRKLNDY